VAEAFREERKIIQVPPEVDLNDMLAALRDVLGRAELFSHHHVQMEPLSVRERMTRIIDRLRESPYLEFTQFFSVEEGRAGVVVTFLALMELTREQIVDIVQNEPLGRIYVKIPDDSGGVLAQDFK
jgi:segregation and condensation protein A